MRTGARAREGREGRAGREGRGVRGVRGRIGEARAVGRCGKGRRKSARFAYHSGGV